MKLKEALVEIDEAREREAEQYRAREKERDKRIQLINSARDKIRKEYKLPKGVNLNFEFNNDKTKITKVVLVDGRIGSALRKVNINRYTIDDIDLVEYGLAEYT